MRPTGRDLVLIQLIEKLNKVSTRISKVIRCGSDTEAGDITLGVKMVESLVELHKDIDHAINTMQRPSIKTMTTWARKELFNKLCTEHKEEFITTDFHNLGVFNYSLGIDIINKFHLWCYKWNPQIEDNVDTSPNHPEAIALLVIENLWREVKNEAT